MSTTVPRPADPHPDVPGADHPDPPAPARRRQRLRAAAVLLAVLTVAVGGLTWWDRTVDAALADAEADLSALLDQVSARHDEGETLHGLVEGQVADPGVLVALAEALVESERALAVPVLVDASRTTRTEHAAQRSRSLRAVLGNLGTCIADVEEAHERWVLDAATAEHVAARDALSETVAAATTALAEAEGGVGDDAVRVALQTVLDPAVALLAATAPTDADGLVTAAAALREQTVAVEQAVQAVRAAQTAWQAEQERQAAEAAAAATRPAGGSDRRGGGASSATAGSSGAGSSGTGATGSTGSGGTGGPATGGASGSGGSGGTWVEEPDGIDWGWCADTAGNAWEC